VTSPMTELLTSFDPTKLRSSPVEMRIALTAVCEQGGPVWTGELPQLLQTLHDVARVDVCLARLVEGHADGLRIIDQAGARPRAGVYGVWASRSAGTGLRTEYAGVEPRSGPDADGGRRLYGELRFASGIDLIDRALAPAALDDHHQLLFDIDATDVVADESSWATAAMDASRSLTVDVDTVTVEQDQIGGVDFYLARPGFVVGGLAVAAVWAGGARHVVDAVSAGLRAFPASPHQLRRLGLMEQSAWTAELAVASTARSLPSLSPDQVGEQIARARTAVVLACDTVLGEAPLIVGPGGLSRNARLARVLADLGIYVRQHHLDNELTRLGAAALETPPDGRG
jgi:hypothetical protein